MQFYLNQKDVDLGNGNLWTIALGSTGEILSVFTL